MFRILFSLLLVSTVFSSYAGPLEMKVMTFNLRYENDHDGVNSWSARKSLASGVIAENSADFVGLQEALHPQLADLLAALPQYDSIGVGRDDGREAGEYSAILFDKERFAVLKSGTFWLSATPEKPGLGWDAACPRIATWGIFEERKSGQKFFFINTHLDHKGEVARVEGARLIAKRIGELRENLPVIMTGDFNSLEQSPAMQELVGGSDPILRLARNLSRDKDFGGNTSFNGFALKETGEVIDFILVSSGIDVDAYHYLHKTEGGVIVSDHWPVLCALGISDSR